MSTVLLTYTPTDLSYEHVIDFRSRDSQYEYYYNQEGSRQLNLNIPADAYRQEFEVDIPIEQVVQYDYCVISGIDYKYYYFITGSVQKGLMSTIFVELDVLSTYYFDMRFNESFVSRCHVPRWTDNGLPTANYEDEGLEYGAMVIQKEEEVKKCRMNFVITASSPIGKIKKDNGGEGGGGEEGGTTGDWNNGIPSKDIFRFIKGYEGFAPYLYNDSGGVATIGYGITNSEPTEFNNLKANQPCSEELCAKTLWKIIPSKYGKPIVNAIKSYGCTTQQQFDALMDLSYNAGIGRITNPEGKLSKAIKRDPLDESYIRPIWENYIVSDAQGNILEGLKLRRKAECDIYFKHVYEKRKIPKLGSGGNIVGTIDGDGWLPTE